MEGITMKYSVEVYFKPNPASGKTEGFNFGLNVDLSPEDFEAFFSDSLTRGAVSLTRQEEFIIIPRENIKYIKVRYQKPAGNSLNAEDMEFTVKEELTPEPPISMEDIEYGTK